MRSWGGEIAEKENVITNFFKLNKCIYFYIGVEGIRFIKTFQLRSFFFFFLIFIYLFINLWLCWVFISVRGLYPVVASGGYSSLQRAGFSLQWLLLLRSTDSRHAGFSSCGTCSATREATAMRSLHAAMKTQRSQK